MFKEITSIQEVEEFIETNLLSFVYITRTNCGVCHALLPQIEELLGDYPEINACTIRIEQLEEAAGLFSVFTVPVLLLFVEGKEYIRVARFVNMQSLREKIEKIVQLIEK